MKNLGAFLVGMSLVAGAALAANPVTSVNIVGFNKVDCPRGKFVLVTTAFKSINGAPLKSEDVFGSQLPDGSTIFAYDATIPAYVGDTITFMGWDANITYKGGMGLWIYVDPSAPSNTYSITLSGEVPMQSVSTNIMYSGYNLAGFPFTASVLWTNTVLAKEIEAKGEGTIFTYDPVLGYKGNGYTFLGWDYPDMVIEPGMGYWLHNPSTTYTNLEVRPYNP
jgi:hypothetical protein